MILRLKEQAHERDVPHQSLIKQYNGRSMLQLSLIQRLRMSSVARCAALCGLLLAAMSCGVKTGPDGTKSVERSYDRDLLKMGIRFVDPPGWRRVVEREPGYVYVGFTRDRTASMSVSTQEIDEEKFQRDVSTLTQKEQTSLAGTPCYVWLREDMHRDGFKVKRKTYTFFKNGKGYVIAFSSESDQFEAYLPAFEQAVSTFELVEVEHGAIQRNLSA